MGNEESVPVSTTFSTESDIVAKYNNTIKEQVESDMTAYTESINNVDFGDVDGSDIKIKQSAEVTVTQEGSMRVQYALESNVSNDVKLDLIRTALTDVENSKLIGKTGAYSDGNMVMNEEIFQNICNEMAFVLNTLTETSAVNNIHFGNVTNSDINITQMNRNNNKQINKLMADFAAENGYEFTDIIDENDEISHKIVSNGFVTEFSKMINDLVGNVTDFFGSLGINTILLLLSPIIIIIVIVVLILLIKLIYKYLNNKIKSKEQTQQPTEQQIQN